MKDKIAALKLEIESLKTEFEVYIQDQNQPLADRWQTWLDAPSELKNQEGYITSITTLPNDWIMYDGRYHADKYQTVYLQNVVEQVEEILNSVNEWDSEAKEELNDFGFTLVALKEEILQGNLESFDYDW